jgi:type VI secretion system protein ImpE
VPTRYVGTETRPEAALRLARTTEWHAPEPAAAALGLGQRMLATESDDVGLLECRLIEIGTDLPPPAHG